MLIRLIGLVTIEHEGLPPLHVSSAQAQAALARLVLERDSGTSREHLADTLWPEGLPDTWASALRGVVSRVRSYVTSPLQNPGGTPLISQSGRYLLRLPDDAAVDLEAAEAAVAEAGAAFADGAHAVARRLAAGAVANLRGSFLPAHEGEWADGVRDRVDELRLTALELASLSASELGDEHHALRYAEEAVRHAPFRESAHRCRMTAHAAAGNRADALRAYHQLGQVLAEELGIDPAAETQAAYLQLLRSDGPTRPHRPSPSGRMPADALDPVLIGAFEALSPPPR
ncbi:DNA-binding protein (plasmid) [Streptomyces lunaelactis]|uniref:DNA-binding protein n=1 Tax=Streptomyces lunaelactis TaxID=1535768 RepID=A0A2R4TFN2_9ACTN|nr:bacterial transcriptional activator domain-containing protein [Streptomyces lunaelactis]AVZ77926.1 DNA-binding protein [Streptomyces lunaelactis]NUK83413.1 DNA-binding protein [Streptomyces lunaelactis]NUL01698.1 DNA-binding protein [Streptomyces lunaelactis]